MGGLGGGIVGAIVTVNFVIYLGVEGGYEASIADVFAKSTVAGVVSVVILVAGPVGGVVVARRRRRRRAVSK